MPAMVTRLEGESVEIQVTADMVKRGLVVAPLLVAIAGVIWGADGAWSAVFAIALVLLNFLLSAALISYTAKISLGLMMGATLFGYLIRLGLIMLAVLLVKDASWISLPALGTTIIVTHLGLLVWELKYVAISLAYPGLKPARSS
jgi:hypothetical protein